MANVVASGQITLTSSFGFDVPTGTMVAYGSGSDTVTLPTTWNTTIPTSDYIWERTYADTLIGAEKVQYEVYKKDEGGKEQGAISDILSTYSTNNSNTAMPTSGWSATIPSLSNDSAVWERSIVTYGNGAIHTIYLLIKEVGSNATKTKSSVVTYYGSSTSGEVPPTSYSKTVPTMSEGNYLWTQVVTSYQDGSITNEYRVNYQGTSGQKSGTVNHISNDYSYSTFGDTPPVTNWMPSLPSIKKNIYVWSRLLIFYDGYLDKPDYVYIAFYDKDSQAVSVKSLQATYATTDSPIDTPKDSDYNQTYPSDTDKAYIWTKTVTTLSNNTTSTDYAIEQSDSSSKSVSNANVINSPLVPEEPTEGLWWNDTSIVPSELKLYRNGTWQQYRVNSIHNQSENITTNNIVSDGATFKEMRSDSVTTDLLNTNEIDLGSVLSLSDVKGYTATGKGTDTLNYDNIISSNSIYSFDGQSILNTKGLTLSSLVTYGTDNQIGTVINGDTVTLNSAQIDTRIGIAGGISAVATKVVGTHHDNTKISYTDIFSSIVSPFSIKLKGYGGNTTTLTASSIETSGSVIAHADIKSDGNLYGQSLAVENVSASTIVATPYVNISSNINAGGSLTASGNNLLVKSDGTIQLSANQIVTSTLSVSGNQVVSGSTTSNTIDTNAINSGNFVLKNGNTIVGNFGTSGADVAVNVSNGRIKLNANNTDGKNFNASSDFLLTGSGWFKKRDVGIYPARYNNLPGIRIAGTNAGIVFNDSANKAYIVMQNHWNEIDMGAWGTGSWSV